MKLGNLIIIVALAIGGIWLFGSKDSKRPSKEELERAEMYARHAGQPELLLTGKLFQHTDKADRILVNGTIDGEEKKICALICVDDARGVADGEDVAVKVWEAGTYQYTSVKDALETVKLYLECPEKAESPNIPKQATTATPIPSAVRAQTVAVRGTVVGSTSDGALILNCNHPHPHQIYSSVAAPINGGGQQLAANLIAAQQIEIDREKQQWGELLIFQDGQWKHPMFSPPEVEGKIVLKGFASTAANGQKIHVIAAPLREANTYAANFILAR